MGTRCIKEMSGSLIKLALRGLSLRIENSEGGPGQALKIKRAFGHWAESFEGKEACLSHKINMMQKRETCKKEACQLLQLSECINPRQVPEF